MDNEIKRLLKDNLLKIQSEDFTAQTMQKIHEIQEGLQFKRKIKWLCLFIGLNILVIQIEFVLLFKLVSISHPHIMPSIRDLTHSFLIQLPIAIAVAFISLFLLDNLIRIIISNNKILAE